MGSSLNQGLLLGPAHSTAPISKGPRPQKKQKIIVILIEIIVVIIIVILIVKS